eukprot:TRINITY_DN64_c0_g1_i1.p1 TRINITY_DN64_c0_g1~~TRINITY_DN64_c0_g1_i1.p1  ORF type:complete len:150 (+),score=21.63 TRINITY_DN64_c0_g1_i1:77-526(+)
MCIRDRYMGMAISFFLFISVLILSAHGEKQDPIKPPNSPAKACERALKAVGQQHSWWRTFQYMNYCYYNDPGVGDTYWYWPKISVPKNGTVVYGDSSLPGEKHAAIVCGKMVCHIPWHSVVPPECDPLSHINGIFRRYNFHYPPGYASE